MPRQARMKSLSGVYHVIIRGINHGYIFEEEADYNCFLNILERYSKENVCDIYAYALMGNHVHLLLKDNNSNISKMLKQLGVSYVLYFNRKYERTGHLFQDRFKSEAVERDSYLLTVLRYIHQNPLKAGLVKKMESYCWSSYPCYLTGSGIVNTGFALSMFGDNVRKFASFNNEPNSYFAPIDFTNRVKRITDNALLKLIKEQFGVPSYKIKTLSEEEQKKIIKKCLKAKASLRQISRIIGLDRKRIKRLVP